MIQKRTEKVLAWMLTMALVVGSFVSFPVKAEGVATIYSVKANVTEVPANGGNVEVTVKGENLPNMIYYRVQEKVEGAMGYTPVEDQNGLAIACPNANGGKVSISIKKNDSGKTKKIKIGILEKAPGTTPGSVNYYTSTSELTQKASSGTETPETDKTELNKLITQAEGLNEAEYTTESWSKLQTALTNAKKVKENASATKEQIAEATTNLQKAIKELAYTEGAGNTANIRAIVKDESGKGVAGLQFVIIDASAGETEIARPVSDENGIIQYPAKDLVNGEYQLKLERIGDYFCQPNSGYIYGVAGGKVVKVDGKAYTGEKDIVFTAKKIGGGTDPEKPQVDKKSITVNVTDTSGLPFDDCGFTFIEEEFKDNPNSEGMAKKPKNGVLTLKITDTSVTSMILRVHKNYKEDYTATPAELKLTLKKGEITHVNGEEYNGTQKYTVKVKKNGEAQNKPSISTAYVDKESLTSSGGTVKVSVGGRMLKNNLKITVFEGAADSGIQAAKTFDTDTFQEFDITLPANETAEKKTYRINCSVTDEDDMKDKNLIVTVDKKQEVNPDGTNATITSLKATPETLAAKGGTIKLNVEGSNLTSANWAAEAVGVLEGTDLERGRINATEITETGAILTIGKNPIQTNRVVWTITAGPIKEGVIEPQQTVKVYQDKNAVVETVDITDVSQVDDNTIVATFEKEIQLGIRNKTELKKLIYVNGVKKVDDKDFAEGTYHLQKEDEVTTDGNQLIIKLNHKLTLGVSARLHLEQGSLKTMEGVLIKEISYIITSKPSVNRIEYEKDVFDYKGGTAVAKLKGIRLAELKEGTIVARVLDPVTTEVYEDTGLKITLGAEPIVTFNVPENKTNKTQSYLLSIDVDGTPVYEGVGSNPARRAIVSVLPKGADPKAQTLSGMTITGNNKIEETSSTTSIEVAVSKQEGELKTKLKLSGTNLNPKTTKVRAIDESGVIWPVYDVPE